MVFGTARWPGTKWGDNQLALTTGPDATEWMQSQTQKALGWTADTKVRWYLTEMPPGIWTHERQYDGIWICLVATKLMALLTQHPTFTLQNRKLTVTRTFKEVIKEG